MKNINKYMYLNLTKIITFFSYINLIHCNRKNKYSECFYNDSFNYIGCIISMNYDDHHIKRCIDITGNSNVYDISSNNTFNYNIPIKYNCNKDNNMKMYKNKIDPSLELIKCFINYKNKKDHDKVKNCNKINSKIDFKKKYMCFIN